MDRKRTIKTPPGKPSVPIEQIRKVVRTAPPKRKCREELEDIILDCTDRGGDKPSSEEIQRFKEAEEELEKLIEVEKDV